MPLQHHNIHQEFPEYHDRIAHLKKTDAHFVRLFDEYDAVEHAVHRIESGAEAASDTRLEALKKQRVNLKDMLFSMLSEAA